MSEHPATCNRANCCVLVARRDPERGRVEVQYPPLPPGAREHLECIVACQRSPLLIAPDELRDVRDRYHVAGIALVQTVNGPDGLSLPPATAVPFEPVDLDERRADVGALLAPEASGRNVRVSTPSRTHGYRMSIRFAVPVLWAVIAICALVELVIPHARPNPFAQPDVFTVLAVFLCAISLLVDFVVRKLTLRWYLVPGGLARRRSSLLGLGWRWELFTPRDSILTVVQAANRWTMTLDRNGVVFSRVLTRLECAALLAVWQSPVPPPSAELLYGMTGDGSGGR